MFFFVPVCTGHYVRFVLSRQFGSFVSPCEKAPARLRALSRGSCSSRNLDSIDRVARNLHRVEMLLLLALFRSGQHVLVGWSGYLWFVCVFLRGDPGPNYELSLS